MSSKNPFDNFGNVRLADRIVVWVNQILEELRVFGSGSEDKKAGRVTAIHIAMIATGLRGEPRACAGVAAAGAGHGAEAEGGGGVASKTDDFVRREELVEGTDGVGLLFKELLNLFEAAGALFLFERGVEIEIGSAT